MVTFPATSTVWTGRGRERRRVHYDLACPSTPIEARAMMRAAAYCWRRCSQKIDHEPPTPEGRAAMVREYGEDLAERILSRRVPGVVLPIASRYHLARAIELRNLARKLEGNVQKEFAL